MFVAGLEVETLAFAAALTLFASPAASAAMLGVFVEVGAATGLAALSPGDALGRALFEGEGAQALAVLAHEL